MTHTVATVTKALRAIPGVTRVEHAGEGFHVTFKPDVSTDSAYARLTAAGRVTGAFWSRDVSSAETGFCPKGGGIFTVAFSAEEVA